MLSTVTKTDKNTVLGKLHQTYSSAKPGSKEWKAAKEQLEKLDRQKKKRVPSDRHEQRMSALYVDAVASPDRWNRPVKEISQISAFECLVDAGNDYGAPYRRYTTPEAYKPDDTELYTALEEWTDRPTLAPPPLLPPGY